MGNEAFEDLLEPCFGNPWLPSGTASALKVLPKGALGCALHPLQLDHVDACLLQLKLLVFLSVWVF
jgi:hypothetical protein